MIDTSESTAFTTNERRIISITSIGHSLCHIGELAFAAVIGVVMVEFELGPDRVAALMVPGFLLYGVGAVPAGVWTDRRGAREVLTAYFGLLSIAAMTVCLSRTVWQLGGALTLLGLAISLYHPAGLTMISNGCRQRGRAMGINGVAGSLGVALGPAIGLYLASQGYWRATYALIAIASLLCAAASMLLPIDLAAAERPSGRPQTDASSHRPLAALPLLFMAMLLGGVNYRCITTALPTYLSDAVDSKGQAATKDAVALTPLKASAGAVVESADDASSSSGVGIVFLILALGGIGQLAGGYLSDRFRPEWVYPVAILLTIPFALVMAHGGSSSVMVAGALLAIVMFTQQPLENVMIAEATPLSMRSTVYGLKFILVFGLASIGAYLTGWIWKQYGLARVFDVFAGVAATMALVAALYAWRSRRRNSASAISEAVASVS